MVFFLNIIAITSYELSFEHSYLQPNVLERDELIIIAHQHLTFEKCSDHQGINVVECISKLNFYNICKFINFFIK